MQLLVNGTPPLGTVLYTNSAPGTIAAQLTFLAALQAGDKLSFRNSGSGAIRIDVPGIQDQPLACSSTLFRISSIPGTFRLGRSRFFNEN
ncbi:hypothetical protein QCI39_28600 [Bacillus cereus group sp. MG7w]